MKPIILTSALIAVAALAAGCERPTTAGTNAANSAATAPASSTSSTVADNSSLSPSTSTTTTTSTAPASGESSVVGDTVMTGKVKAAIAADSGLKDADISVKTDGSVVQLTGTAKSQDQIVIATNLAQSQPGVSRVDNQITVR